LSLALANNKYTENIRIYNCFATIYGSILYHLRGSRLPRYNYTAVRHGMQLSGALPLKATPKNSWTKCMTPSESSITPAIPNKPVFAGSENIFSRTEQELGRAFVSSDHRLVLAQLVAGTPRIPKKVSRIMSLPQTTYPCPSLKGWEQVITRTARGSIPGLANPP
jgi:hypothetical protein